LQTTIADLLHRDISFVTREADMSWSRQRRLTHHQSFKLDDDLKSRLEAFCAAFYFDTDSAAIRQLMRIGFETLKKEGRFPA
jgi:hypothetical protein